MRPGKRATPHPKLDLEKLWEILEEEPPGKILTVNGIGASAAASRRQRPSSSSR